MTATRHDVARWLKEKPDNAHHMIVVCNTFDWEDFPVYVSGNEDTRKRTDEVRNNGNRVMEVYSFSRPIEAQLQEHRAFHYD